MFTLETHSIKLKQGYIIHRKGIWKKNNNNNNTTTRPLLSSQNHDFAPQSFGSVNLIKLPNALESHQRNLDLDDWGVSTREKITYKNGRIYIASDGSWLPVVHRLKSRTPPNPAKTQFMFMVNVGKYTWNMGSSRNEWTMYPACPKVCIYSSIKIISYEYHKTNRWLICTVPLSFSNNDPRICGNLIALRILRQQCPYLQIVHAATLDHGFLVAKTTGINGFVFLEGWVEVASLTWKYR